MATLDKLEKVQRQAIRFVCNYYNPMDSATGKIEKLRWQKLENHYLLFKIKCLFLSMKSEKMYKHQLLLQD